MKKKTQKLLGLVMAAAVAASMLAGCSRKLSGTCLLYTSDAADE